ncbi:MAG: SDR family oxidoreductase, partial [Verrucomicrobiota bacterium]|nr:SDR family oxidoreductase [Verrucomicrobiota bacterium]
GSLRDPASGDIIPGADGDHLLKDKYSGYVTLEDSYLENVPVGRWGTREEVAEAVRFFAEEHSGFLTGQTLAVNGGRTLL